MFRPFNAAFWRNMPLFRVRPRIQCFVERRFFSAKAIYASFPCTLHYYSPRKTSSLYNQEDKNTRPYRIVDEEVKVSNNGLLYPAVRATSISNGATMYPNTFLMQELVRRYFDENIDREEEGETVETPYIYTIAKGTKLPADLVLINDYISKFSLQPSRGMPVEELNGILDELYEKCAHKETADQWIDTHQFHDAVADDADALWMAQ
ncbi:hypothetical protein QQS21_005391 [Conoideocrella luteorostrata]|uniref:Tse2 ADP-ribosyltransferase toxin domain-containing protein n=1 Tax=Conoideocrella luteorostrata TaxID=1105319 RepID=A0AAJ0CPH5_9HYPO|nr:hypothetical protein QQS21_005391 [Conoideocrella luteorostrata]